MFPVVNTRLPALTFPVTLALPAVIRFPPVTFPVAFSVPATFTPVPVATSIFALPATDKLMLPFAAGILTFEFPFACGPIKLPAVTFPVTDNELSVPTLVMLGCAAVITVPAVAAFKFAT